MALLEIRHLSHSFGGLRALHDLSITLRGGELMGLIGPNGAGKTTVFNLVCGFYQPTAGEILFAGESIVGLRTPRVTAVGIARTFQNIRLWNELTVYDNLCISQHHHLGYGLVDTLLRTRNYRERDRSVRSTTEELLELLGLQHYAREYRKNLGRDALPASGSGGSQPQRDTRGCSQTSIERWLPARPRGWQGGRPFCRHPRIGEGQEAQY